ncbi:hypothetical protein Bbelb_200870 [Branchiostoma belcheri]|nr:hypothetical protein Bbelb_200870 [Branchiostoma belcheri]
MQKIPLTANTVAMAISDIDDPPEPVADYNDKDDCTTTAKALHGVNALLAFAELVLGFVVSIMCCCGLCSATNTPCQIRDSSELSSRCSWRHLEVHMRLCRCTTPRDRHRRSTPSRAGWGPLQYAQPGGMGATEAPPQYAQPGGMGAIEAPPQYAQPGGMGATEAPPQYAQPGGMGAGAAPPQYTQPGGMGAAAAPPQYAQPGGVGAAAAPPQYTQPGGMGAAAAPPQYAQPGGKSTGCHIVYTGGAAAAPPQYTQHAATQATEAPPMESKTPISV